MFILFWVRCWSPLVILSPAVPWYGFFGLVSSRYLSMRLYSGCRSPETTCWVNSRLDLHCCLLMTYLRPPSSLDSLLPLLARSSPETFILS
ncbi:hypothetical protein TNCT_318981 [Trichonephila clavata]|uniref:Uncharacterized protein n=1 Tax=Trichonephila clavata TaxID=2740835 RepID=A0A8X6GQ40_TRICU|nr:hypothetical protein TNCT_318981 [Trichonephila clavata]